MGAILPVVSATAHPDILRVDEPPVDRAGAARCAAGCSAPGTGWKSKCSLRRAGGAVIRAEQPREPSMPDAHAREDAKTLVKVVILAGGTGHAAGRGDRGPPKPMVEIGGRPILWHIMKHYAALRLQRVRRSRWATRAKSSSGTSSTTTTLERQHDRRPRRRRRVDRIATRLRRLDGPPGRHRPGDATPAGACKRLQPLARGRHVHAHLRRRRLRRRSATRCSRSTARTARWRRSPPCGRRRASAAWSSTATASSSSPRSRRSARAGSTAGSSSSSPAIFDYLDGDDTSLETRRPRAAGRRGAAGGVPARRLLAVHGHAARQAAAGDAVAKQGQAPWKVWRHERRSGATARRSSPARPAWSAAGWCGASWRAEPTWSCLVRDWVPQSELVRDWADRTA